MVPIVAEPGNPVTIEVKIMNVGRTEGSQSLALTVNGAEEEVKDVTLAPRASKTVAFTLVKDSSGLYEIEVAGLTKTLRVKQNGSYPRLGNNYVNYALFRNPTKLESMLESLARWDIITVPYFFYNFPQGMQQIRTLNPQIKILAWFEFGLADLWELQSTISSNESWYLHFGNTSGSDKPPEQRRVEMNESSPKGEPWLGMNPASDWSTYVPNYIHDKIMSTGFFNGVYYDWILESTSWRGNIDINNDGVADSPDIVDSEYINGMTKVLKLTRELLGPDAIIIGNPGAEWSESSPFWAYANGLYQENALGNESWSSHDFSKVWGIYQRNMQKLAPPSRISWIGADVNNKEYDEIDPVFSASELQKARYGLAITLLDDGYFGFDRGDESHKELWWLPEYDANLGLAQGKAQQRSDGTWVREFDNGTVIVNTTGSARTIQFTTTYQDVTTGNKGTSFTIQPQDGRIFILAR